MTRAKSSARNPVPERCNKMDVNIHRHFLGPGNSCIFNPMDVAVAFQLARVDVVFREVRLSERSSSSFDIVPCRR
jgi:hypothetical protein